jgi:hypothetical protein
LKSFGDATSLKYSPTNPGARPLSLATGATARSVGAAPITHGQTQTDKTNQLKCATRMDNILFTSEIKFSPHRRSERGGARCDYQFPDHIQAAGNVILRYSEESGIERRTTQILRRTSE